MLSSVSSHPPPHPIAKMTPQPKLCLDSRRCLESRRMLRLLLKPCQEPRGWVGRRTRCWRGAHSWHLALLRLHAHVPHGRQPVRQRFTVPTKVILPRRPGDESSLPLSFLHRDLRSSGRLHWASLLLNALSIQHHHGYVTNSVSSQ